jgi:hypothetical protein
VAEGDAGEAFPGEGGWGAEGVWVFGRESGWGVGAGGLDLTSGLGELPFGGGMTGLIDDAAGGCGVGGAWGSGWGWGRGWGL